MLTPVRCEFVPTHPASILDEVVRIYEASIPASERKPIDALRAMATRRDYRLIAALRDDVVLGFAALFAPPDETFALLEYLAVDEASRGGGIGATLFRAAAASLARPDTMLLVEVDAEAGDGDELEQRRRRQAFYRRLDCRRVRSLRYDLPLRTAGQIPPLMNLFVHGGVAVGPIARAELARVLRGVYEHVYGQRAGDSRIDRMVADVADPIELD
jgi:GNAT superfamily N-acetyltransferase